MTDEPLLTPDEAAALCTEAVVDAALDAAVRVIQEALGVEDGLQASLWWNGEHWNDFAVLMRAYARSEGALP